MCKPKIKITLVDRIGKCSCHRGHKIGDTFDYDTDCGKLCPMAVHVAFPYIDILRYGGTPPTSGNGSISPKSANVIRHLIILLYRESDLCYNCCASLALLKERRRYERKKTR